MVTHLRGFRLRTFQRLVEWAQRFAPLREDALADVGLGWPVVRRMLHEIGERLVKSFAIDTANDVFWLRLDEVQAAVAALDAGLKPPDSHTAVAERRANREGQPARPPPGALPGD